MSPEEVLDIFHDWQRFVSAYDTGAEASEPLRFESPISEWMAECQLHVLGGRLWKYLNRVFSVEADEAEWNIVLADDRNLQTLCEFISDRTRQDFSIQDAVVTAMPVSNDRMFKALRRRLTDLGVEVKDLRPSTPLEPYVIQHFEAVAEAVTALSPGSLPEIDLRWKIANPISVVFAFVFVYCLFQALFRYSASVLGSMMFTGIVCFFIVKLWDKRHATKYFTDMETFGDLTRIMVQRRNEGAY